MNKESTTTIAIMTNSCTLMAAAWFPLYLVDYRGRCERLDKESGINTEVILPSGLRYKTQVKNTLQNPKEAKMISVDGIVSSQQKGTDFKLSMMENTWLEAENEPHYGKFVSKHSSTTRTVESDYEATILESLDYVRKNAIKEDINPPFLRKSYMVMESLDGLPMDLWDSDHLSRLIGMQFYNLRNPLNRGLYTLLEYGITKRDVPEYRVVKTFGADS